MRNNLTSVQRDKVEIVCMLGLMLPTHYDIQHRRSE